MKRSGFIPVAGVALMFFGFFGGLVLETCGWPDWMWWLLPPLFFVGLVMVPPAKR